MKKQVIYLATTALLTLGLAACSSGKQEQAKTSSSQKTSQVKKASHKKAEQKSSSSQSAKKQAETKNQQASVWDQSKTQQLTTFMTNWGYTMQQSYQAYSPQNPGKFMGIPIPTGIYPDGLAPLAINEPANKQTAAWSNDGTGPKNTYNIVASYVYHNDLGAIDVYAYLFAFYNGKPVALVTNQNEANTEGTTVFKETANPDVKAAFAQIAAGKGIPAKYASPKQKVEANTKMTTDLALRVFWSAKKAEDANWGLDNVTFLFMRDVSNQHVYDSDNINAVFPANTYMVGQSRASANDVAFQLIGNNKAKVYYIPGSLGMTTDDVDPNDIVNNAMSHPQEVEILNVDSATLDALKAKLNQQ